MKKVLIISVIFVISSCTSKIDLREDWKATHLVINNEDSVGALDALMEDVETVLEAEDPLTYYDKNGVSQKTVQTTIVSIDTDEGVMDPLGIGEIVLEVQY